jgi:hypothetical protein
VVEPARADGRLWPRVVALAVVALVDDGDGATAGRAAILAAFSAAARAKPRRPPPVAGAGQRGRILADPRRSICEKERKKGRSRTSS